MICPFATVKLLSANSTHAHMAPTAVVLHSQGGHGSLHDFFEHGRLQSHFWVAEDGRIEQYMDTQVQAWHAFTANHFAVGIESESTVAATEPWADAQLASIVRLVDWICTAHNIPREIAPSDHGPGIGWHAEFPAWNQSAHACPGAARVDQIHNQIIPALQAPSEEFTMDAAAKARFDSIDATLLKVVAALNQLQAAELIDIDTDRKDLAADSAPKQP